MDQPDSLHPADVHHRDLPTFELDFAFDDEDRPREVTIYLSTERGTTSCWLTMDVEHAVDLTDVA